MKNDGFTLSEVLITLLIIGVVAAMTLPILRKTNEVTTVAKVKRTYALLANAYKLWSNAYNCDDYSREGCMYKNSTDRPIEHFLDYLKVQDKLLVSGNRTSKKWINTKCGALLGSKTQNAIAWIGVCSRIRDRSIYFLLPDGTTGIISLDDNTDQSYFIWIDINGTKQPNRVGYDIFPIGLWAYNNNYYRGIHPYYTEDNSSSGDGKLCAVRNGKMCNPDDGKSPTAYILKYGKMPNYKKLGIE